MKHFYFQWNKRIGRIAGAVDLSRFRDEYEAVAAEHDRIAREVRAFTDGIGERAAAVERWREDLIGRVFSDLCVECGVVAVDE